MTLVILRNCNKKQVSKKIVLIRLLYNYFTKKSPTNGQKVFVSDCFLHKMQVSLDT